MSESHHHRYIPACYLAQWAIEGLLCEMHRVQDKVILEHKRPDDTGDFPDLYEIEGVSAELTQDFATRFLAAAATEAHHTLEQMGSGQQADDPRSRDLKSWDAASRDAWARFIASLIYRSPQAVAEIKANIHEILEVATREMKTRYATKRSDPKLFAEFITRANPEAPAIAAATFLQKIMNSEATASAIGRMNWARIVVTRSRFTLLTSDNPLDIPLALAEKNAYIALPLGPRAFFIAANNAGLLETLIKEDHSKIVRMLNLATVTQARDYVWGVDESQYAFVKNHFGSAPARNIVADKARETALAALKG